jgi:type IV secretion system protein VirB10
MSDAFEPLKRDNLSAFEVAPQVGSASSPWALIVGVGGAIALGLLVFSTLNAGREQREAAREQARAPPPEAPRPRDWPPIVDVAPFEIAPEPEEELAAPIEPAPSPAATTASARLNAPALIIDLSEDASASAPGGPSASAVAGALGGDTLSGDERFAARFGAGQAARARLLASPGDTIPQGAIITGVLETAINSDLPGYARALVSRDVRSFNGAAVLAPRGSRLVGQYRAGVALGQSRVFVIWTRLVRPDGVAIDLNSPGADALGRGGLEGETDRHFLQRFGGAILLTLLGGAADAAAADDDTQVVIGVARGGGDAAAAALAEEINISPTIRVAQGTPIRIFVSRDLDFSSVAGAQ